MNGLKPAPWRQASQALRLHRTDSLVYDALVTLCLAALVGSLLHPDLLSADTLPTGGDTASQVLYAKVFTQEMLPSGRLTGWMPEVFAGFPLMSYYFPLPFIAAAGLSQCLGLAAGLKWAMVLPSLLLPGSVFALSRHLLRLPSAAAWSAALASLAFLLHEQNAIWGGNLLSVLAGEFAYSWGMWLALLTLAAWWRAAQRPELPAVWVLPAVLEALTGLCHGYPLLWVGSASGLLVLSGRPLRPVIGLLLKGHVAAFALLGGWLWPLLEMHGYTIPNDAATPLHTWADALPPALWPVLVAGVLGLGGLLIGPRMRSRHAHQRNDDCPPVNLSPWGLLSFATLTSAWAVCASMGAERVGLLDVRFLPLAWLMGAIVCGWAFGLALAGFGTARARFALGLALMCGLIVWLGPRVREAPAWAYWNHSGLEVKPQWQVLSRLLPLMSGTLASPRLLFEHDPANTDLGSTRVLEALPMFLGGRPVLEGLYMESALLGPAVYQLQSEVSARPSSPLVRFPSGQLDPVMAAAHMQLLHANQVLLRSREAAAALKGSGLFELEAAAGPFKLLRLRGFIDSLVDPTPRTWIVKPRTGWMMDSYRWFRSARLMGEGWPVYTAQAAEVPAHSSPLANGSLANAGAGLAQGLRAQITALELSRHRLKFSTDGLGQPHLIKMAFHPRWDLKTRGSLLLAAPGFMLVVPEETQVELHYGTTWVGRGGEIASALAVGLLVWTLGQRALRRRRMPWALTSPPDKSARTPSGARWWAGASVMVAAALLLSATSPGIAYYGAWEAFRQGHHEQASTLFYKAYKGRRSPAGQEEALFWAAKAADAAGDPGLALARYSTLADGHDGHWVAESLHEISRLALLEGNAPVAELAQRRLREEFPRSPWAAAATAVRERNSR